MVIADVLHGVNYLLCEKRLKSSQFPTRNKLPGSRGKSDNTSKWLLLSALWKVTFFYFILFMTHIKTMGIFRWGIMKTKSYRLLIIGILKGYFYFFLYFFSTQIKTIEMCGWRIIKANSYGSLLNFLGWEKM